MKQPLHRAAPPPASEGGRQRLWSGATGSKTALGRLGSPLPRDMRDTLFLLAVIGWVVFMQVGHIPWWCSALTAVMLVWRARLTLSGQPLPGWAWRMGLLALTLGATWLTHRTLLGRDAGVTLIVVLLALKTLEMRARRDAFVVFFLSFFTLLTHFFYSQSLLTAAGILIALLGLLTALVNAHMPVGQAPLKQSAAIAGKLALVGTPIMLVLFMLFPRMAPLWGMPSDSMSGRSGLSEQMRVGEMARLALDDSIAMRVQFEGPAPPQQAMYFRGPVFSTFNGVEWFPLRSGFVASRALPANLSVSGAAVRYTVTLESHSQPWLLTLDASIQAPKVPGQEAIMGADLQWRTRRPTGDLLRYSAESHTVFRHGPLQPELALQDFVELPASYNPRTLALAQALRRQHGAGPDHAPALVAAVMDKLRTGGYTYTLEPGVYGRNTADEFWFDRREGFCEHIASSFVILMRAMDIPARIVTGYQGGQLNAVGGYWTVRQSDAHAWTEVWLQGQGWVRVDPTSAVAPGRTGAFERLRAPEGAFAGAVRTLNPTLAANLRAAWEAVNNRWNQTVLNYSQGRQLDLLKNLGFDAPSWTDLAYVLIGLLVAVSLGGAAWSYWERQQHDPWLRLLTRARERLDKLGVDTGAQTPPRELARLAQRHFGDTAFAQGVSLWLLKLEAQRYSRQSPLTLATLQREFQQLPWPKGHAR
jgi:transglutaminase-like putative cysteine protease